MAVLLLILLFVGSLARANARAAAGPRRADRAIRRQLSVPLAVAVLATLLLFGLVAWG